MSSSRPDEILKSMQVEMGEPGRGRLKIFFGYAAGVGKTYAMLDEARRKLSEGLDLVIGYVEPHQRAETNKLLEGLPTIPTKVVKYRNLELSEFDLDAALSRKPDIVIVDELAHTNTPDSRNLKRFQDVEELLNANIDVYTTLNVQHIESVNDVVQEATNIVVKEVIPDVQFDAADSVKLIDIEPSELLVRLKEGKVYKPNQAGTATQNFFTIENLRYLRSLALRKVTNRIRHESEQVNNVKENHVTKKLLVCFGSSPTSPKTIRSAARTAEAFQIPLVAINVELSCSPICDKTEEKTLRKNFELAKRLGAEVVILHGDTVAETVADYAKRTGIYNVVIGRKRSGKSFGTSLEERLVSLMPNCEIHIISSGETPKRKSRSIRFLRLKQVKVAWRDTIVTFGLLLCTSAFPKVFSAIGIDLSLCLFIIPFMVLLVSLTTSGKLYGVVSAVVGVLAVLLSHSGNAIREENVILLSLFTVSILTAVLTSQMKRRAQFATEKGRRTEVLYEINKRLLKVRGHQKVIEVIADTLVRLYHRTVIFYFEDPVLKNSYYLKGASGARDADAMKNRSEQAVAHWVFLNRKNAGAGTDTLMGSTAYYVPVMSQREVLGVLGISSLSKHLSHDERLFLQMILTQAAIALERQRIVE